MLTLYSTCIKIRQLRKTQRIWSMLLPYSPSVIFILVRGHRVINVLIGDFLNDYGENALLTLSVYLRSIVLPFFFFFGFIFVSFAHFSRSFKTHSVLNFSRTSSLFSHDCSYSWKSASPFSLEKIIGSILIIICYLWKTREAAEKLLKATLCSCRLFQLEHSIIRQIIVLI